MKIDLRTVYLDKPELGISPGIYVFGFEKVGWMIAGTIHFFYNVYLRPVREVYQDGRSVWLQPMEELELTVPVTAKLCEVFTNKIASYSGSRVEWEFWNDFVYGRRSFLVFDPIYPQGHYIDILREAGLIPKELDDSFFIYDEKSDKYFMLFPADEAEKWNKEAPV